MAALVERLLAPGSMWVNEDGKEQQLTGSDIRVVAPFNAQVNRLAERLGPAIPGGDGRQVPGANVRRRHLLDDDVTTGRCAERHGVSLQPESPERGHLARSMRGVSGGVTQAV